MLQLFIDDILYIPIYIHTPSEYLIFIHQLYDRVYDTETTNLVQVNNGHTENIRCIEHIVERNQVLKISFEFLFATV